MIFLYETPYTYNRTIKNLIANYQVFVLILNIY